MNKIQITEKYWITSDSKCWMVSQYMGEEEYTYKGKTKIRDKWKNYSYHGTFEQAVKSLTQRLLREAGKTSVAGLREAARDIEAILEKSVKQAEIA